MKLNDYIYSSPDERLKFFLSTLSITNRTPEYYINWEKVERETRKFELELNTLNYLLEKMISIMKCLHYSLSSQI